MQRNFLMVSFAFWEHKSRIVLLALAQLHLQVEQRLVDGVLLTCHLLSLVVVMSVVFLGKRLRVAGQIDRQIRISLHYFYSHQGPC